MAGTIPIYVSHQRRALAHGELYRLNHELATTLALTGSRLSVVDTTIEWAAETNAIMFELTVWTGHPQAYTRGAVQRLKWQQDTVGLQPITAAIQQNIQAMANPKGEPNAPHTTG